MGFFKSLKFWDANAVIDGTVEAVSKDYSYYKSQTPERDPHFWLSAAYMNRPGYRVGKDVGALFPLPKRLCIRCLMRNLRLRL